MAPSKMMINPAEASLVRNPINTAVAPNGSAMDNNRVVNSMNGEMPSGACDQNANFT